MNMASDCILWGATGQARVLRETLRHYGVTIVALFDNNAELKSPFPDVPIFAGTKGFENWLVDRKNLEKLGFLVAIGGDKGEVRCSIQSYLETFGLKPLVALHPTAFVAQETVIGAGSQILAQSAVCSEVRIGKACIVNTSASVDHECVLEDGVHICPGARLAGCVRVGAFSMVGTGAVVLPWITIGERCVVGAGAVVTKDIPDGAIVVGNPARAQSRID